MTIKARLKKLEQAAQVDNTKSIQDMTSEELLRFIGGDPVRQMSDAELEEIINAEKTPNGNS